MLKGVIKLIQRFKAAIINTGLRIYVIYTDSMNAITSSVIQRKKIINMKLLKKYEIQSLFNTIRRGALLYDFFLV